MLSPDYDLSEIQSIAFTMNLESTDLLGSLFGSTGQLTPQMILDRFSRFERSYQLLKSHVDSVQQALDAGHDPDRGLFLL